MTTAPLQDENGYFKIAAMDHRGSLQKMIPEQYISTFKTLLSETYAPYSTAILVDPGYGAGAIEKAREANLGILLSREESGYMDSTVGRVTTLSSHTSQHLKHMGADAIKLLLYYNSDAANAETQLDIARTVFEEAHMQDLPLLIEPITYEVEGVTYHKGDAIIKAIKDLRDFADVLKLEFPINVDEQEMDEAIPYLKAMTDESKKPWVLLSRGMEFDKYKEAVQIAKDAGCMGYAVGRAVWQEAKEKESWEDIVNFIKIATTKRMKQLSEVF